jgi:hypothetical protein
VWRRNKSIRFGDHLMRKLTGPLKGTGICNDSLSRLPHPYPSNFSGIVQAIIFAFLLSGIAFAACPGGMVGYWNFNEGSGINAADTLKISNGTLGNTACTPGNGECPTWTTGLVGNALNFDGNNDYVAVPDASGNPYEVTKIRTWEAWVNLNVPVSQQHDRSGLLWRGDSYTLWFMNGGGWNSYCTPCACQDGQLKFDSYYWQGTSTQNINWVPGQWYYVVATYNDSDRTARIYVNGQLNNQCGPYDIQTRLFPGSYLLIGTEYDGRRLNAKIDEVALYNRPLTQAEVTDHYNNGNGKDYCGSAGAPPEPASTCGQGDTAGMVSYYRANNNASDFMGTNNGVLRGDATYIAGKVGQGFYLDGSGDYVELPAAAFSDLTSYTIESWVNNAPGGTCTHFLWNHFKNDDYKGEIRLGGGCVTGTYGFASCTKIGYVNGQDTWTCCNGEGSAACAFNSWCHVAVVFDGTTRKIYVNGTEICSVNAPGHTYAAMGTTTANYIGWAPWSNNEFGKGGVDEFAVYNRALSLSEIQAHIAKSNAGQSYCSAGAPPNPNLIKNSTGGTVEDQGITVTIPPGSLGTTELLVDIVESEHSFAPVTGITVLSQPLDIGPQCTDIEDESTCESTNGCRFNELGMCESIPFSSPVTITMPGDCSGNYGDLTSQKIAKYNYISGSWEPVSTCDYNDMGGGIYSCQEGDGRTMTWDTNTCTMSVQTYHFSTYAVIMQAGYCGDGMVNGEEQCDTGNLNSQDCSMRGYIQGELACTAECTFDTSGCECQLPAPPCSKNLGACSGLEMQCIDGGWADCTESDYMDNSPFYSITENSVDNCWDTYDNDCNGLADKDELACQPGGIPLQTCLVGDMMDLNNDKVVDSFDALIVLRSMIGYPNQMIEPKNCQAINIRAA